MSPLDEKLITSLPDFKLMQTNLEINGHRKKAFVKDSLVDKMSNNIFMCDNTHCQNLMARVTEYLANPGNRRHTVQEFFAMVSNTTKVEAQYVECLKCFSQTLKDAISGIL